MSKINKPIIGDYFEKMDRMYPDRNKQIHKVSCKHCPSECYKRNGMVDPESEDIKLLPKEVIAKEYLFVCAWRNSKLCKGNCDYMEIDQQYLNDLYNEQGNQ